MAYQPHRTPTKPVHQSDLSADELQIHQEFEIWLLAHRGLARATVDLRLGFIRRILHNLGLVQITPSIAERYIADLRSTGASYAHVYNAITALEEFLAFEKMPIRMARPRKPKNIAKYSLSETEIALVLHHARDLREKTMLATLAYSGIRNNEFCNLRIGDVDIAECQLQVHFGKGSHNYRASITGECAKLLHEYIYEREGAGAQKDSHIFITKRHGYPLEPQDLRKIVRLAVKRAGITKTVSPHLFRHSLAMNMVNRGASLLTIQKQLGHTMIETTMEYLRGEYTRGKHEYPLTAPQYM